MQGLLDCAKEHAIQLLHVVLHHLKTSEWVRIIIRSLSYPILASSRPLQPKLDVRPSGLHDDCSDIIMCEKSFYKCKASENEQTS